MLVKLQEKPLDRDDCTIEEQFKVIVEVLQNAGLIGLEYDPVCGNIYHVERMPSNSEKYGIVWNVVGH